MHAKLSCSNQQPTSAGRLFSGTILDLQPRGPLAEGGCVNKPKQKRLKHHPANHEITRNCAVITGGHYDVDCYVEDPLGKTIYRETKKQYDSFTHRAEVKGVYQFCFSNEFSTFSHKTVYFDFQVGDEPPILPDMGNRVTALTQMESACVTIHEALKTVIDSQTHYRLREAQDRARAEELNSRVSYWSVGETVALFLVSFGQVLLLKSFFTEKRPAPRVAHS
ncbi:transmembrane emp24 domain-containing protein 3 [Puma concolor]|uniref:Transmembrane emp24 domain-containing protein 3 n=1 Tax=Puma concolor TaxID=9696 RepID=A0A6P6HFB0_PUMCO|nr:transmembrane emp24 domain-containing protein 3 [Puma concolor]